METIEMRDFAVEGHSKSDPPRDPCQSDAPASVASVEKSFWSKYIRVTVEEAACRDHFALERTFLAYVRTASAYAQFGVTMAQLFRLNNARQDGGPTATTLKIGSALGATTEAIAIILVLIGCAFAMKQQRSMVKGVIMKGGLGVVSMSVITFMLLCVVLGLLAAANRW